jgi:hypothetical protein
MQMLNPFEGYATEDAPVITAIVIVTSVSVDPLEAVASQRGVLSSVMQGITLTPEPLQAIVSQRGSLSSTQSTVNLHANFTLEGIAVQYGDPTGLGIGITANQPVQADAYVNSQTGLGHTLTAGDSLYGDASADLTSEVTVVHINVLADLLSGATDLPSPFVVLRNSTVIPVVSVSGTATVFAPAFSVSISVSPSRVVGSASQLVIYALMGGATLVQIYPLIADCVQYDGTSVADVGLRPFGLASSETFGTASIFAPYILAPVGIISQETMPVQPVIPEIDPPSIASQEAIGSINTAVTFAPDGMPSQLAFGSTAVGVAPKQLTVTGIATQEAVGTPDATPPVFVISTVGIDSTEVVSGTYVAVAGTILSAGIISEEAFGFASFTAPTGMFMSSVNSGESFGIPNVIGSVLFEASFSDPTNVAAKTIAPPVMSGKGA